MATNITMALPCYGNQISVPTFQTIMGLQQMFMQKGIGGQVAPFSYPDVAEARNILLTAWYDQLPQSTHMLFIDSDMGFGPEVVSDMLVFGEPIVGALYSRKTLPTQWAGSGMGDVAERRGDFMKVAGLGMGCFLIRRDAIDLMLEKMPELIDTRMQYHCAKDILRGRMLRLFDGMDNPDDNTHGRLSEDLAFCARWRQCGGDVWAAIGHTIDHIGSYSYKANYMEYIQQKTAKGELPDPSELAIAAE